LVLGLAAHPLIKKAEEIIACEYSLGLSQERKAAKQLVTDPDPAERCRWASAGSGNRISNA
jgi:hypothetical protein